MKYSVLNENVRKILNSEDVVPHRLVRELGLPNTVMLKFIKGQSEKLTVQTMERLIAGLGFQLEVKIIDEKGEEVSVDQLAEKIKEIAPNKKKESGKSALSIIAGAKKEDRELKMSPATESKSPDTKAPVEVHDEVQSDIEDPGTIEIPDLDIDLEDIFPKSAAAD